MLILVTNNNTRRVKTPASVKQLAVQLPTTAPQPRSGLLRGDVPLRLGHQLVSDEELADGGGAEERRVEVHVKPAVFGLLLGTVKRRLVNAGAWSLLVKISGPVSSKK
jgi:hypothetical protein